MSSGLWRSMNGKGYGYSSEQWQWGRGTEPEAWPAWSAMSSTAPEAGQGSSSEAAAARNDDAVDARHEAPDPGSLPGPTWSQRTTQRQWDGDSWQDHHWNSAGWQWNQWWQPGGQNARGDFSDPPAWGGWGSYRLWKRSVRRWDANTDVPVWRRFEKLAKQMDWELQAKFEHVPDQTLNSAAYLDEVLRILDAVAGEKEASEKRRVVRTALFEGQRRKDETLSQFALRREQEFLGMEPYLPIAPELKAFILEETAGLSKQGVQNLRTLTGGGADYQRVMNALKLLDVEEEPMTKGKSTLLVGSEDEESDDSDLDNFLAEVDGLDESEALDVLAAWEKGKDKTKRTWRENKERKMAAKKDRRVFGRDGRRGRLSLDELKKVTRCANCGEKGHWRDECTNPYKPRAAKPEVGAPVKAVSFVYYGQGETEASSSTFVGLTDIEAATENPDYTIHHKFEASEGGFGLVELENVEDPDYTIHRKFEATEGGFSFVEPEVAEDSDYPIHHKFEAVQGFQGMQVISGWCGAVAVDSIVQQLVAERKSRNPDFGCGAAVFLALEPGHAILDIGAGQDLIGLPSYEKLEQRLQSQGLKCVKVPGHMTPPSGVGGKATPLFKALIPCILGGVPGIVKVTVVREDIPRLLSVGLLEATGACINMRSNVVEYQELGAQESMQRLRSGHRTVDIASWKGGTFPVPQDLCEEYGLTKDAFQLSGAVSKGAQYTKGSAEISMGSRTSTVLCEGGRPDVREHGHRSPSDHVVLSLAEESHVRNVCAACSASEGTCILPQSDCNSNFLCDERACAAAMEGADLSVAAESDPRGRSASPRTSSGAPLPSPSRVCGERGQPVRKLGAVLAVPNQAVLRSSSCEAPAEEEGCKAGNGLSDPRGAQDEGEGWTTREAATSGSGQRQLVRLEGDDRGAGQGDAAEHFGPASHHGGVKSAGDERHRREQSSGADRDRDDGGVCAPAERRGRIDDSAQAPSRARSGDGQWGHATAPLRGTTAGLLRRQADGTFLTWWKRDCRTEIPEVFYQGMAKIGNPVTGPDGKIRVPCQWKLPSLDQLLDNEDLLDESHVDDHRQGEEGAEARIPPHQRDLRFCQRSDKGSSVGSLRRSSYGGRGPPLEGHGFATHLQPAERLALQQSKMQQHFLEAVR